MASGQHMNLGGRDSGAKPPSAKIVITPASVRDQTERVLADPLFHNSKRYSSFLKYIVDRTLEGQHESLKERIIGIEAFGRTADFDTALDASVRVAATEVRKRLALYYKDPAHELELRIDVPAHSYVAEFKAPEEKLEEPSLRRLRLARHLSAWLSLATVVLVLGVWGAYRALAPAPAIDRFWEPVLNYPGPIAISVGSPPQVNSQPTMPVPPNQSSPANAQAPSLAVVIGGGQATFPLTDLNAETAVAAFLGRHGKDCEMRFAQTTTLEELKGRPLVILGSFRNDWAVRLGADLRYLFREDLSSGQTEWIEDTKNPGNRNWSVDLSAPSENVTMEYALITRAFNKSTGQWWIGAAGLTGIGTRAAQQMLLDPKAMTALSNRLPRNWDRQNLQVVLAIEMVKASPGTPQVVATYSW